MDNVKIGALIAVVRKERGLTQKELGKRLHVSDRAVSKWERGLNLPDAALFEPLCRELGITVTELLRGERQQAALLELEQVINDTVALAGKKERAARRNRWAFWLVCILTAAAVFYGGWRLWEKEQLRQFRSLDTSIPNIGMWYDKSYDRVFVDLHWGGHHAPLRHDGSVSDADLRIWFPPDSTTIRNKPTIYVDDGTPQKVRFGLSFDKDGMEVKVLRWPYSTIGTRVTLEEGEEVPYEPAYPLNDSQRKFELLYAFDVEPEYFYSIVYFWGDGYWLEHPFRAEK